MVGNKRVALEARSRFLLLELLDGRVSVLVRVSWLIVGPSYNDLLYQSAGKLLTWIIHEEMLMLEKAAKLGVLTQGNLRVSTHCHSRSKLQICFKCPS